MYLKVDAKYSTKVLKCIINKHFLHTFSICIQLSTLHLFSSQPKNFNSSRLQTDRFQRFT